MAIIQFIIKPKPEIIFEDLYATFISGESQDKEFYLHYSNATNQSFTDGQVLYESGIVDTVGYVSVISKHTGVLSGDGSFLVSITVYPNSTQSANIIPFQIDGSDVNINASYNSKPEVNEITTPIINRTTTALSVSDFNNAYFDFDGNALTSIAIFGDVSGIEYNGIPYVAGTWVEIFNIPEIKFTPLDQNAYYVKSNTWKAKDSNGNVSNTSDLDFEVFGLSCTTPILVSATSSSQNDFELEWSYNGVDYSAESPPMELIIYYSIDGGVNFIQFTTTYPYTETSKTINIPSIVWETIIFKVVVQTRTCFEYSNEITLNV